MGNMKAPWDPPDEELTPEQLKIAWAAEIEDTITAIQRDMAFACRYTAIMVRSSDERLRMVINTERGQKPPPGEGIFTDGTTIEMQDIGMPQPNVPTMTVQEMIQAVIDKATELGLELA